MFYDAPNQQARLVLLGALAISLVILIPLIGLVIGLVHPGVDNPFAQVVPGFIELFQQAGTTTLLLRTLSLSLLVSGLAAVIGLWLAWVEQRASYPGGKWLGILNLLPLAMPSYLIAITLREILAPSGAISHLFNLPIFRGFFPAVIVLTLTNIPYVQLLISAALKRHSLAEEEAARSLGAGKRVVFWRIVFPHLRPSFAFAWLLTILYVISDFGAVAVLDTQVLTWRLYQAVEHQQLYQATLFGVVIMVIAIPLVLLARYIHGSVPQFTQVSNPRPSKRQPLGWPATLITYGLHAFVIGLGVLLPVLILLHWVFQAWGNGIAFSSLTRPISDTLAVALPSALLIVILALFPAWIVARSGYRRMSWVLEQGTYITSSLPGILLAFGLLITSLQITRGIGAGVGLYQFIINSGILLFIAYIMRFISVAYAGVKSAILLFDPRLSESARLLKAGKWRYGTKILMPTLLPGFAVSFTLVLMGLVKELPITLLLGGAMGIRTLSYRAYDYYQEALFHEVGLTGLVILLITFFLLCITLPWRRHA